MTSTQHPAPLHPQGGRASLGDLARLFLRMSLQAFGGPIAHIAMAEDEVVTRRQWMSRAEYLDIVAAANLIPGPNSTETMIHIGYRMQGVRGAIVAGACFIVPAFLITLTLAVLYGTYGTIPQVEAALWGIQPVILAIILVAAYRLFPTALNTPALFGLAAIALLVLATTSIPDVFVYVGAGLLYALYVLRSAIAALLIPLITPAAQAADGAAAAVSHPSLVEIGAYFLYLGSVLFGSGYVLVAYLQADVVAGFGWLTERQLLDAVAIGQFTPGPVLTTAAVVGYLASGFPGALIATFAIFLPSFVLVILTAPLIPRMRRSRFFGAFLSGVNAAVIAGILWTVWTLLSTAVTPPRASAQAIAVAGIDGVAIVLGIGAAVALTRFKVNATWLVIAGAAAGFVYWGLLGV